MSHVDARCNRVRIFPGNCADTTRVAAVMTYTNMTYRIIPGIFAYAILEQRGGSPLYLTSLSVLPMYLRLLNHVRGEPVLC